VPIGEEPAGAEPMECDEELLRHLGQQAGLTRLRGATPRRQVPPLTLGYTHHGWLPQGSRSTRPNHRSTRPNQATVESCTNSKSLLRGGPLDTE
jgi:hypothetical protein